ncbi:ACP7 [Cordylochernes scorpioides]|uniref:ACP7 n=1 Tax=Cordylochernes scorpioides TaxID=51811 RepID=A0ABY6L4F5_9ARAC|nr:ACP7 [Cordylochernes scorpioides]
MWSQGCQEKVDPFIQNPPAWSALRSSDYGYTRLAVVNSTHLYFEQVSDDQVVQAMIIIVASKWRLLLLTWSQGCQEKVDPFIQNPPAWSALRSSDYGYTRLAVVNSTHLYFEQVSDDQVLYIQSVCCVSPYNLR